MAKLRKLKQIVLALLLTGGIGYQPTVLAQTSPSDEAADRTVACLFSVAAVDIGTIGSYGACASITTVTPPGVAACAAALLGTGMAALAAGLYCTQANEAIANLHEEEAIRGVVDEEPYEGGMVCPLTTDVVTSEIHTIVCAGEQCWSDTVVDTYLAPSPYWGQGCN